MELGVAHDTVWCRPSRSGSQKDEPRKGKRLVKRMVGKEDGMTAITRQQRKQLWQAHHDGLIDKETLDAALVSNNPVEIRSLVEEIEDSRGTGKASRVIGSIGNVLSAKAGPVPVWLIALFMVLFSVFGGIDRISSLVSAVTSGTGAETVVNPLNLTEGRESWIKLADGVYFPLNRNPFPKVPFSGADLSTVVAVVLIYSMLPLAIVDNYLPRPNQTANHRGNIGLLLFFAAPLFLGYWPLIVASFGLFLCVRNREGNQPGLAASFFMILAGLWIWFEIVSPVVNRGLNSLMNNPNFNWVPPLLRWAFESENSRPLVLLVVFGFLIWSAISRNHDSSTLIVASASVVAWRLMMGVWLFAEGLTSIEWLDTTLMFAFFIIVAFVLLVEQSQSKIGGIWIMLLLAFSFSYCVTFVVRDWLKVSYDDNTLLRWITQPVVFCYLLILVCAWFFNRGVETKSKFFDGFFKLFSGMMGNLLPVGPFQLPVDALYMLNWLVVIVLTKTQLPIL